MSRDASLPSLPVTFLKRGGPARGDDAVAPLKCTWYRGLSRIATIGDGSCFVHALLKAFYAPYQESDSSAERVLMTRDARHALAAFLDRENPAYPGHTYWETSGAGSLPRLLLQEIAVPELTLELGVDFTVPGLRALFESDSWLGDEVYSYIADVFDVDIYVLRATRADLYPHLATRLAGGPARRCAVIVGNRQHYEVVATGPPDALQTLFPPDHPFIGAIDALQGPPETFEFDPATRLATEISEIFGNAAGVPVSAYSALPDDDPFVQALLRGNGAPL